MRRSLSFCSVAVLFLILHGCESKPMRAPEWIETVGQKQSGLTKGGQGAIGGGPAKGARAGSAGEEAAKTGRLDDIFFDFDSYALNNRAVPTLQAVAEMLAANRAARLTIEGHCDERGTVEYNLVLGQKRAEAAKDYLVKLGVDYERIKTISYGKEAPTQPGHTEADWAGNRRDHFVMQ